MYNGHIISGTFLEILDSWPSRWEPGRLSSLAKLI